MADPDYQKVGRNTLHLTMNDLQYERLKAVADMRGEEHMTTCVNNLILEEWERIEDRVVKEAEGNVE